MGTTGVNPNRIPGTEYEIHGNMQGGAVFTKDGKEISKDEFLQKVASKEISLTQNSLTFLDSWLGPDTMKSLKVSSGFPSPPGELSGKLGTSDQFLGDLYKLMEILEKTAQDQKKQMNDVKHVEQDSNIQMMQESAKKEMDAAVARAVFGFISAGITIGAGVVSVVGSSLSLKESGEGLKLGSQGNKLTEEGVRLTEQGGKMTEESQKLIKEGAELAGKSSDMLKHAESLGKVFGSVTQTMEGVTKGVDSSGGIVSSGHEQKSKQLDIQAKKVDQTVEETKNNIDTLREMHAKVKELLQAIQQAEDESSKSVARM
jgi:hypothetical protein